MEMLGEACIVSQKQGGWEGVTLDERRGWKKGVGDGRLSLGLN